MPVRELTEADLPAITRVAHLGLEFDEINKSLIREKTVDAKDYDPNLGLLWEEAGEVAAFAQGAVGVKKDGSQPGYVRIMAVHPAFRNRGIGTSLLKEMEARLKGKGCTAVSIMDSPNNYFMPGVDFRYTEAFCFLQKHGYEMFRENHNLICDLDLNDWPDLDSQIAELAKEGVELRRAVTADGPEVHDFLEAHWPGWHAEVQGALDNDPPTLYIGRHEGRVIAFSGYQGNNKSLSWFGPMGTLPVLRGKGIGGILLRLCLRDLARQGYRKAIIPWVGPVRFYARYSNARLDRCFWAYRKNL
ncbi:MAG: GNAT family N-acetyltransferase [Candidatus Sumerlaeaceae bacterium]|nr:GNAT family N-acetyltransferase [Candidatus Sumerlaeaceae bacterium]